MHRIDTSTAAAALPTPAGPGPKPNGFFTGGNPGLLIPPTIGDQDFWNAVQEEIANAILLRGVTPLNKADNTQLYQALTKGQQLLAVQAFGAGTSMPTFNAATTTIEIELVGGCGGAGGNTGGGGLSATAGAGSGAYCFHRVAKAGFVGATLVVGAGGAGGTSGGGAGNDGADSTYGTLTCPGGKASAGSGNGGDAYFNGGKGGSVATGANIINEAGQSGGLGISVNTGNLSGNGGVGMYNRRGGDGVAGSTSTAGHSGSDGFCLIREYG